MTDQIAHLEEIADHLEFLGYEVEEKSDGVFQARHEKLSNFVFRNSVGGVLQTTYVKLSRDGEKAERYDLINDLNGMAAVGRFYFDSDDYLTIEGWWPRLYEKKSFSNFMESWNDDLGRAFGLLDQREWF